LDIRSFEKPGAVEGKGTVANGAVSGAFEEDSNISFDEKDTVSNTNKAHPSGLAGSEKEMDVDDKDIIQEYLNYLEEREVTKEDIFAVLDSIITTGEVYWQFSLFNKIPVVFKMRPAWVNAELVEKLDNNPPKTLTRFSDLVSLYNLAGSLIKYGDHEHEVKEKEDLDFSLNYVMNLPFIIQNRLIKQMAVFDRVIAVATSDWAVENFTEPLSEK